MNPLYCYPEPTPTQIGTLGFRLEGDVVNAYWIGDERTLLGSIRAKLCEQQPGLFDRFKELMRDVMGEAVFQSTGQRAVWGDEGPAPEHERAGHA